MKAHSTISIDPQLKETAQEQGFNLSNLMEQAIRLKLKLNTDKLPVGDIRMKCSKCNKVVGEGYVCELLNRFICKDCENGNWCLPKDHEHRLIPGFGDIRVGECSKFEM